MKSPSPICDAYGRQFPRTNGHARPELAEAFAKSANERRKQSREQHATYDAASQSDEYKNYWAASDVFDADSANSRFVRSTLVRRSRYDVGSNGYSDGIASTYATDLIGAGPTLRMQTGSENFNRMVETAWFNWCKKIQFRRKLWCIAHAKHVDGEGLGVLRRNANLKHPVKLDWVLHETEQCQTPYLPYGKPGYIDGIEFDEFSNPTYYDILKYHPGSSHQVAYTTQPEKVPAAYVTHWFKMRRPGQHRAVPECSSTLNLGASARRWREATVAAAENIADFTLFIKTQFEPEEMDSVSPMSTIDVQKRMITALPAGHDAFQPKAEQPTAGHAEFSKSLINEQARPKSMPYNKAACDSSSYNYASGRLDHQTYYGHLNSDRNDCDDCVLDPMFSAWFDNAVIVYGWLGGNPDAISEAAKAHLWDWPKHPVADIGTEADASDKKLKNGTASIASEQIAAGLDPEDELIAKAQYNGVTLDQQRQINMLLNLPQHVIPIVAQILKLVPEPTASAFKPPAAQTQETPSNGGKNIKVQKNSITRIPKGHQIIQAAAANGRQLIAMSAPVTITAAEGESANGPKAFTSTFYTGGALNIAGWDLPVVVDLAGLKASKVLVANLDHDSTKRVGNFQAINDGKTLVAVGKATAATAARDEVVNSAQAGYEWQASLEVSPTKVETLAKGKTVTVNGQEITGPAYITRTGTLKGFGFVSHGADDNTTATIAAAAASSKKGNEMDPKLKEWIEAMGFDTEAISAEQLAGLKANFEGQKAKTPVPQVAAGFEAIKAERQRVEQITAYALDKCERQPMHTDSIQLIAEEAIEKKWTVEKLRLEILEAMTPEPRQPFARKREDGKVSAKLIEAAICAEHGYTLLEDKSRGFDEDTLQMARDKYGNGIGLRQLYRICAKANGYTGDDDSVTMDMHRYACQLAQPGGRQQHAANSTISLPGILSNIANKFLADGWEAGDMTWKDVSAQRTVRDFKANTTYKLSGAFKYEKVGNGGQLKHGTVSEDTYTNQAETYGKMFGVSRTDIINDDLGAFTSILREMSFGAIDSFNEVFWTEFLADQSTFFAGGNNNTSSGVWSSAALATLTAAELVFMNQTQPNGRPLGMMPDRILLPPGSKRYGMNAIISTQVVGSTGPTPANNSFAGEYKVLSTPYIANSAFTGYSTVKWYMLCNPSRLAMIEACFLNGKQTPTVESGEAEFNTLGVQMRGYHDFGCNKQEYRAVVQGSGA